MQVAVLVNIYPTPQPNVAGESEPYAVLNRRRSVHFQYETVQTGAHSYPNDARNPTGEQKQGLFEHVSPN
jgi:hypothetical protein